jgi:hypothetical protein
MRSGGVRIVGVLKSLCRLRPQRAMKGSPHAARSGDRRSKGRPTQSHPTRSTTQGFVALLVEAMGDPDELVRLRAADAPDSAAGSSSPSPRDRAVPWTPELRPRFSA